MNDVKPLPDIGPSGTLKWKPETACDPYLVWADLTTNYAPDSGGWVGVLVELTTPDAHEAFRTALTTDGITHFIPGGLRQPKQTTCFLTGFVTLVGLRILVGQVGAGAVERFSLQQSRTDLKVAGRYAKDLLAGRLAHTEANVLWATGEKGKAADGTAYAHKGTFIGVIDDGFPFVSAAGLTQNSDRRVHLWDQGWESYSSEEAPAGPSSSKDPYWQTAWGWYTQSGTENGAFEGFLYGRELKTAPEPAVVRGDSRAYVESHYFDRVPRHTHGAAVLGLAAPWALRGPRAAWPDHVSGLALVQLPTRTVDDTSGGSLAMRVLDGLRYILWQESMTRPPQGNPRNVVVNVSYGVQAGPHDGSSMFERALKEMLDQHEHLHVVLPAGNSHLAGGHARRRVEKSDKSDFHFFVLPDNASDTHVELWLPLDANAEVHIQPPGMPKPMGPIRAGEAKVYGMPDSSDPSRRIEFAAIYPRRVAQSNTKSMLLLCIGATRNELGADGLGTAMGLDGERRRAVLATPGLWRMTVTNCGTELLDVDAWIERDDAGADHSGGNRQAYFPDSAAIPLEPANATPEGTLNGIATLQHARAHVVGATQPDGEMARYSAAGDAGQGLPSAAAPADWSWAVSGLKTHGFAPGTVTRINGTSAASAVFARKLAVKPVARELALEPPPEPVGSMASAPSSPQSQLPRMPRTPPEVAEHQRGAPRRLRGPQERPQIPFDVFSADAKAISGLLGPDAQQPVQPR